MNLFIPSPIIETSVQSLDDRRLIKMCLETAQLLSTAVRIIDEDTTLPVYKLTHKNHPVAVWVRQTSGNYIYTLNYFKAICDEYSYRFKKTHKSFSLYPIFVKFITSNEYIPLMDSSITPFANCTDYKTDEVHTAYKKCLTNKWNNDKISPRWTKRNVPSFFTKG